jgi:hypothetical protein
MQDLDEVPPRMCMETFFYDALNEFANSDFYSKDNTEEEYNFPVLFGDDGAFTDAAYNFKFIDKMIDVFHRYSMEIFGKQIDLKYSTMDEFLTAVKK